MAGPPIPLKATTDLVVAQRGPKLILSWNYPSLTTSGKKLPAIQGMGEEHKIRGRLLFTPR